MNCGEIYLANFPFTDHSGGKVRPVLVVSSSEFNTGEDRLVVPISSQPDSEDPHSFYISVDDPAFKDTGLKRASSVKWTKVLTISKTVIQSQLGFLAVPILNEVRAKICSMFE